MERYLAPFLKEDLTQKITLISGPRQCGKTTLAKSLLSPHVYLNYDLSEDRILMLDKHWRRDSKLIILDELHKMPAWKQWIKGIFDSEGNDPPLLVTGSANMEAFTKVGDSLAGRYFHFRLHPIDLKEALHLWKDDPKEAFNRLFNYGGFPEPFLSANARFYRRWQKTHLDVILRQDLLDLYALRSIKSIETLVSLLKKRVAHPISYANLANDLQVDPKTVKSWISILENFYVLFKVTPYHHNIARSILKEPKIYFFDTPRVSNLGDRLENLVACSLIKEVHFIEDTQGFNAQVHFLKTTQGQEIDFLIAVDEQPVLCLEVKTSDNTPSTHFFHFKKYLGKIPCIQLVLNLEKEFDTREGIQIRDLISFLKNFNLMDYISSSGSPPILKNTQ